MDSFTDCSIMQFRRKWTHQDLLQPQHHWYISKYTNPNVGYSPMLIFKNNIYDQSELAFPGAPKSPDPDYDANFSPKDLLTAALKEEQEVLDFIGRQPSEYWGLDTQKFYPYAYKSGDLRVLRQLQEILTTGLECQQTWYHMNTYHFCYLYDVLVRFIFNYNHDSEAEKHSLLPKLNGKPIMLDLFIRNYFFNTVFLLDADKYNSFTGKEKKSKGYDCPCQFAVINGLSPTHEELQLRESKDYPYSIYV